MMRQTFPVLEMSCAACAVSVETRLAAVPGVARALVNYAGQTALVEFDASLTSPAALREAVQSIGYDMVINPPANPAALVFEAQAAQAREAKNRTLGAAIFTLPVFIAGMFFMNVAWTRYAALLCSVPVLFYFGRHHFIHAWKLLLHRQANMDTLVALSTGIAFVFSTFNTFFPDYWHARGLHAHVYYEAATVIITFLSLGKWLEARAKSNTSAAIRLLMEMQPSTVCVLDGGVERQVALADVRPGDRVLVRPGERIAVDGEVAWGTSYVDESMLTGEPVALPKAAGGRVFAGTLNQKGSLQVVTQGVGQATALGRIIQSVQDAQGSKAPVQRVVDKVAGVFVPVVLLIALATFSVWMLAGGENAIHHALLTSITVLIIACPCALGLATPTAIMVGVGKAAQRQILIKDAESLERSRKITDVVLDKTGTITAGRPVVAAVLAEDDSWKTPVLSLELLSEHPLAAAVAEWLRGQSAPTAEVLTFENITGLGIRGTLAGGTWWVGNEALAQQQGAGLSDRQLAFMNEARQQGKTVVLAGTQNRVAALLAIWDEPRPTAARAVDQLKKMGITVHLLTGDAAAAARAMAQQVGISNVGAEMSFEQKAAYVKSFQQQGRVVAVAGDGLNDAHALALADVGIAMGKGTDVAMEVAGMTLTTSDLLRIPEAIRLSRQTVATIHQNLFWAFIYNLIGIPLAAGLLYPVNGFLLDPMVAGAAMAFSSLSVVLNSVWLKYK
jgi:Cu2+-exporting ATPase